MHIIHETYATSIHAANVEAGWWTDLTTGQPLQRNFGEMLALVHSELSECYEGVQSGAPDDHLPQYQMHDVEIADACIRVYDMLGGLFPDIVITGKPPIGLETSFASFEGALVQLHYILSAALEHYRKSRMVETKTCLVYFLIQCFNLAESEGFNLKEVIDAKLEYNASRADHKIENRIKSGGKKI